MNTRCPDIRRWTFWRNTFSFRLTGALSLDYRVDILEQPQVTDDTQGSQNLLFRDSWGN